MAWKAPWRGSNAVAGNAERARTAPVPRVYDCAIVGAGPAGLMTALALARWRRDVVLIDAGASRANHMTVSRYCPGFPNGISGPALLATLRAQCRARGIDPIVDKVQRLDFGPYGYQLESNSARWQAQTVALATGVVDRLPAWNGVEAGLSSGLVLPCALDDADEPDDRRIAVYGSGEAALRHASLLRTFSSCVTWVHPAEQALDESLHQRALEQNVGVLQAAEKDCRLLDRQFLVHAVDGARECFDVVYLALGTVPQTAMLDALGVLTVGGRLRVDERCETSLAGVFAIGDAVADVKQVGVAFGHAAIASAAIHQRLPMRPRDPSVESVDETATGMDSAA